MIVMADRIRYLREQAKMTQAELARQLDITRSSVNAWEMGISVPSTQYVVELAGMFNVSTDYLLCVEKSATVGVEGLTEGDIQLVHTLIGHLREKNGQESTLKV